MNIFTLNDEKNISDKINLDDLYEKKREIDEGKMHLYNKILNRIHTRIKITSNQKKNEYHCWYIIPEIMIGVPRYDYVECTQYIINKLQENGFVVKYTNPNLLFISWNHWVPNYVRQEFKKKTGFTIDGYGNKINKDDKEEEKIFTIKKNVEEKKEYKTINDYKPKGIYNEDFFTKLKNKIN